ncbi:TPA: PrsW family intramembrane metalloprotease [Streptococcus equi subsp. zooepidemicus]|uniref:PrsW family glutamic-type intramembrane protease n=1 Tax=Streptococcus equi TaxID=1336 RepID=UPI001E581A3B|nr:PrsW family glutamic-type intramembrane protease [Streptococcus equi]MCD3371396.1 PrsW family intramembrane metalloprotease [Streptococcus equi subsp. zooepidemicus]HEL0577604.1 PrsW family intramembrane metalloprotease [Streptococcus equi subsp. zooepidemicus]HEL0794758.1 PrsW family intramembrane metalloprotease [Streptococcus equi subsp. zooepidemicus]
MPLLRYKKIIATTLFMLLVFNGIEYECLNLISPKQTFYQSAALILSTSLLGIYLIPFSLAIAYLKGLYQIRTTTLILAGLGGLYISGFLASFGNQVLEQFWVSLIKPNIALEEWTGALTGPFVEEPIKAFAAMLVIYLLPAINLKQKLVISLISGMGFQLTEDISYIASAADRSINDILPTTLARISSSPNSHWVYTGIFTMGVYLLIKKSQLFPRSLQIFWVVSPLALHFIWNSPISDLAGIAVIHGTITTLIFISLFKKIHALDDSIAY